MNGRIVPFARESLEDRSTMNVQGWVNERAHAPEAAPLGALRPSGKGDLAELRGNLMRATADEPLLFMLSKHPPPSLLSFLLDSARGDRHIYVLATSGFGEGTHDPGLRDLTRAHVLVRRVNDLPASGVLVGRGESGALWLGQHEAAPPWLLQLGTSQGAAAFTAFLHLFWHHAADEAFTTGKPLGFRPAKKRPFDIVLPPHAPVKLRPAPAHLPHASGSAACGPADLPMSAALRVLITQPGSEHHGILAERALAGCATVSNDLELPAFVLGATQRTLAAGSKSWSLHVDLDDAQTAVLNGIVETNAAAPTWRFHASTPLGAWAGKPVWLARASRPEVPIEEQVLDAGRVDAVELRRVATAEPRAQPVAHPLATSVRVRWTVDPPRLPTGAADDKLVAAWRNVDQDTRDRLEAARKKLDAAEQHANGIAAKLVSLASALLGFERGRGTLRAELDHLTSPIPSQRGPDGARKLLLRLRALEEGAVKLADDQREAERKEEERLHVEQQRREWDRAQNEKTTDLAQVKAELQPTRDEQDRLATACREAGDAHRGESDEDTKKDLYTRKRKLDDELSAYRREVLRLEGRARTLEDQLQRPFQPRPLERPAAPIARAGTTAGPRFVPAPAAEQPDTIPTEALPSIGTLRAVKGQRYLVIEQWKDLDAGEQEAHRLAAKLVAPAEGQ